MCAQLSRRHKTARRQPGKVTLLCMECAATTTTAAAATAVWQRMSWTHAMRRLWRWMTRDPKVQEGHAQDMPLVDLTMSPSAPVWRHHGSGTSCSRPKMYYDELLGKVVRAWWDGNVEVSDTREGQDGVSLRMAPPSPLRLPMWFVGCQT